MHIFDFLFLIHFPYLIFLEWGLSAIIYINHWTWCLVCINLSMNGNYHHYYHHYEWYRLDCSLPIWVVFLEVSVSVSNHDYMWLHVSEYMGFPSCGYSYGHLHVLSVYSCECASMFCGMTGAIVSGLTTQLYLLLTRWP